MIQKLKICQGCGKPKKIFSHKKCMECAKKEYPFIRKYSVSDKRKYGLARYLHIIHKMDAKSLKETGQITCFFCDLEIKGFVDHHHLDGRDGDLLTKEKWIVQAHSGCHIQGYHNSTVDQLIKKYWYENVFLPNLLKVDQSLYEREYNKRYK